MLGRVQIHNLLHTEPTKEKIVYLFRGTASQTLVDMKCGRLYMELSVKNATSDKFHRSGHSYVTV